MKNVYILHICLIFIGVINSYSQQKKIYVFSKDSVENSTLRKLKIQKFVLTENKMDEKLDSITHLLQLNGFFNYTKSIASKNDSVVNVDYTLGKQYKKIRIVHLKEDIIKKEISIILNQKIMNSEFETDIQNIPILFNKLVRNFENRGESFTQFSLKNIQLKEDLVIAEISIKKAKSRTIDGIVTQSYKSFPKSFIKHRLNLKKKMIFNKRKLNQVSTSIKSIPFVEEIKKPQTLFTKDSTLIYIYLKKKHSNKFDGLIGFNSKENGNGLEFNGYLDLHLENMFNYGAEIDLKWKSNGSENQKFNLAVKTPYLFNSPFSTKGTLLLYKQDSTYINIKTQLEIEYAINSNNSLSAIIQSENSINLLDNNTIGITDFNTSFYGLGYTHQSFSNKSIFPIKLSTDLSALFGNRSSEEMNTSQTKLTFSGFYNWQLNYKNYIFTKINSGYLISDDYLDNELFRIGGNNSIRGFPEESIFASSYNTFNIEYRYLTKNNAYLYSITDFGLVETQATKDNLFGFGIGYVFTTKIGLLNLNYVLGKSENQNFDFSKAVVGFKYVTTF